MITSPLVHGLHTNAEISYLAESTRKMWINLSELQPRTQSADAIPKETFLMDVCKSVEARIPQEIDLNAAKKKFKNPGPTSIVLLQELDRFNTLLEILRCNVIDLQRALVGEIGMSQDLDAMGTSFFVG